VARHIEQLEASLGGVALFTRSPQGLAPTEAAEKLLPHAQSMESAAAALVRAASGSAEEISGIVRITASEVIGVEVLPPILRDLRGAHPGLVFELTPSNETADLLRRDADIAVRMTRPRQSALVAKKVGDIMLGLHAHRAYLEKYGTPRRIEDLAEHAIIGFDRVTAPVQSVIQALRSMGMDLRRETFAFRSDSDHAQMAALRAGYGLGICQIGLAKRDANLVRLFPKLIGFPLETWITMHGDLRSDPRMRVVFDHLAEAVGAYAASGK
jgi:DNA-binding transcriptional LysR family regulator